MHFGGIGHLNSYGIIRYPCRSLSNMDYTALLADSTHNNDRL